MDKLDINYLMDDMDKLKPIIRLCERICGLRDSHRELYNNLSALVLEYNNSNLDNIEFKTAITINNKSFEIYGNELKKYIIDTNIQKIDDIKNKIQDIIINELNIPEKLL